MFKMRLYLHFKDIVRLERLEHPRLPQNCLINIYNVKERDFYSAAGNIKLI